MPERAVPPDLVDLASLLIEEWSQQLSGTLGELAQAIREPAPVRSAPSDRWASLIVGVPGHPKADRILGRQLDRARVTIYNTGSVTVSLGPTESVSPTLSNRFDLAAGAAITIGSRGEVYAVAPAGSEGQLTLLTEEWDL